MGWESFRELRPFRSIYLSIEISLKARRGYSKKGLDYCNVLVAQRKIRKTKS
jgi:hypothetical protein